jgi:hypothetical protein
MSLVVRLKVGVLFWKVGLLFQKIGVFLPKSRRTFGKNTPIFFNNTLLFTGGYFEISVFNWEQFPNVGNLFDLIGHGVAANLKFFSPIWGNLIF